MKKIINIVLGLFSVAVVSIVSVMGAQIVLPQLQETNLLTQFEEEENREGESEPSHELANNNEKKQGQNEEGIETKKISRLSYEEHIKRGDILFTKNYFALAIKEYLRAAEINETSPDAYRKLGQLNLSKQNYDEAEKNFKKALQKSPQNEEVGILLAQTLIGKKQFKEASEILGKMKQPTARVYYYQGLLYALNGEHDLAKQNLAQAINIDTSSKTGTQTQNVLNVYSEFEKFQAGSPHHLKTLLARSFNNNEEYSLASELLYEVLRDLPTYRDAWILLGYSFLQQEKYLDAKNTFEQALDLDPEKPETQYFLGLAYFGLNNFDKALLHLEIALQNQFKPQIQIKQKLAEIHLLNQNYEQAARYYLDVIDHEDAQPEHFIRPIWLYIEFLKQPEKALEIGEKLRGKYPNNAMSLNLAGWAQLANNRLGAARQDFEAALKLDPNLDAAYLNLGMLYEKEGDFERAKLNYKKAYLLGQGNSIANTAAEKYNKLAVLR